MTVPGLRGGNRAAPHTQLARGIVEYLKLRKAYTIRLHGHLGQKKGLPDIVAVLHGQVFGIDVKTGKAHLSEDQMRERDALEQAGGIFVEAHSINDVEDALVAAGLGPPLLVRPAVRVPAERRGR